MKITLSIILLCLLAACDNHKPASPKPVPGLSANFENALANINDSTTQSLDKATALFQEYALKTENLAQRDSLFMPFFGFYNIGRTLLAEEPMDVVERYGFERVKYKGEPAIFPVPHEYWDTNILQYLSKPMQQFCNQQLSEFLAPKNLKTMAANTIWWENFNKQHPEFFLKEMTTYHYKDWHLKNLLEGTEFVSILDKENKLKEEARSVFQRVLEEHPESETAKAIRERLDEIEIN
ncbi:MAG: tol-pal system YbgF family protein [Bacteroidia bacterium]